MQSMAVKRSTMQILRDESGYILVLRGLQVLPGGRSAAEQRAFSELGETATTTRIPSCSVPHCCFYCSWCGQPILLPNDRIGAPFGNPDARKIEARSIATVCHDCNHVGSYSMFRSCRGFDTRHKITHAPISGETVLLYWLQCVESTCSARVPLFARLESNGTAGEPEAAEWLWDELTCALGHRINPVPVDPRYYLPLRTPAGNH